MPNDGSFEDGPGPDVSAKTVELLLLPSLVANSS